VGKRAEEACLRAGQWGGSVFSLVLAHGGGLAVLRQPRGETSCLLVCLPD